MGRRFVVKTDALLFNGQKSFEGQLIIDMTERLKLY